jgi:hypothetical protein
MTLNQHPDTHKLLNPSAVGLPTATYGKLMMLKRIISFILLILSITACSSGYSDEEVEATANAAYRAGQEAGSSPKRVFLEVTKLEAWDGTGGQCPSLISLEGCGLVQWADGARSARIIYVDQKSNCWLDVKLGDDLPDSCRGLVSAP